MRGNSYLVSLYIKTMTIKSHHRKSITAARKPIEARVHCSPPRSDQTPAETRCKSYAGNSQHIDTPPTSGSTHRVLHRISGILSHIMRNDLLRQAIRGRRIRHQLRMARIVQAGEQERGLIHRAADSQQPRNRISLSHTSQHSRRTENRRTHDSARCTQCYPYQAPQQSADPHPAPAQRRHGRRTRSAFRRSCTHLPASALP